MLETDTQSLTFNIPVSRETLMSGGEFAKRQFMRLAAHTPFENSWVEALARKGPFEPQGIEELEFAMVPLLHQLREDVPEIFRFYYSLPRDGEASELVSALLNNQDSDPQSLARHTQVIRQTLESMVSNVNPELVDMVREIANAPVIEEVEGELKALQQQLLRDIEQTGSGGRQNGERKKGAGSE